MKIFSPLSKLYRSFALVLFLLEAAVFSYAQQTDKAWVFAYFKGNGEDGLHLATSTDGYTWKTLKDDSSFLKPTAGHDKLMRDPCVIRGADGLFHMVWTVSWGERSIGYASQILGRRSYRNAKGKQMDYLF